MGWKLTGSGRKINAILSMKYNSALNLSLNICGKHQHRREY
jgi:hypothetical protein